MRRWPSTIKHSGRIGIDRRRTDEEGRNITNIGAYFYFVTVKNIASDNGE